MSFLFGSADLTPHGFCLLWQPGLLWLHALSDLFIATAYFSVPLALIALVRQRKDLIYAGIIGLFAAFIVACGMTHVFAVVTLWYPFYWVEGGVKALTAALSVATAFLLWPLIPKLVALPAPMELQARIAELRSTQAELTEANRGLALGEQIGHFGHWRISLPDRVFTCSDEICRIFDWDRSHCTPSLSHALTYFSPADQAVMTADMERAIQTGGSFENAMCLLRPSGEVRHIISQGHVQYDSAGRPVCLFGATRDDTEEWRHATLNAEREAALKASLDLAERSEALYRLLAENVTDIVASLGPDLSWTFISPSNFQVTGYQPSELLGQKLQAMVLPEDWPATEAALAALHNGCRQTTMLFHTRRRDGTLLWLEANGKLMPDGESIILSMHDVTARKDAEEALRAANEALKELASLDPLTGLANRRSFDVFLEEELARCVASGLPISMILLDVDHFKLYNDAYGHLAGDDCLRLIANTIQKFVRRPKDLAARYGGEEFVVILPGSNAANSLRIAETMRMAIEDLEIVQSSAPGGYVTASFGVAALENPTRSDTTQALTAAADRLLYEAKNRGRNMAVSEHGLAQRVAG